MSEPIWPCPTCSYDLIDELDAVGQPNVRLTSSEVQPGSADGPAVRWYEWDITCPTCGTVTECADSG